MSSQYLRPEAIHSLADQFGKECDDIHTQISPLEIKRDALRQASNDLRTAAHSMERLEQVTKQSSSRATSSVA